MRELFSLEKSKREKETINQSKYIFKTVYYEIKILILRAIFNENVLGSFSSIKHFLNILSFSIYHFPFILKLYFNSFKIY